MKKAVDLMSSVGIPLEYNTLLVNYNKHCTYLDELIEYLYDNYILVDQRYSREEILGYIYQEAPNYLKSITTVSGSLNLSLVNLKKCKIDIMQSNHVEKELIHKCFEALYEYQMLVELNKFYRQSAFSNKHKPAKINYKFQYILNEGLQHKFGKNYSAPLDVFVESLDTGLYVFVDNLDIILRGISQKYNIEMTEETNHFFTNIADLEFAESIFNLDMKGDTEFAKALYKLLYKDFIKVNEISQGRWHYSTEYEKLYATLIPEFNEKQSKFRDEHPDAEIKYVTSLGVLYKVSSKVDGYKTYSVITRPVLSRGIDYVDNTTLDLPFFGQFIPEEIRPVQEDLIYYKCNKTLYYNKNTPIIDNTDKGYILTDLI